MSATRPKYKRHNLILTDADSVLKKGNFTEDLIKIQDEALNLHYFVRTAKISCVAFVLDLQERSTSNRTIESYRTMDLILKE